MRALSIVIPVWNEEKNISLLVQRIDDTLRKNHIQYEIIFIDDNSTDETRTVIKKLSKKYPISLHLKQGKKGKAYSLVEGFDRAKYQTLTMIDADLQYPPEAIPGFLQKLQEGADIVVANRIHYKVSRFRKFVSGTFRSLFGKLLFGLHHDVQAGCKVFTKEVYDVIRFNPSTGWAFDLEFLYRAKQAGYSIENYDIVFEKRYDGKSKVSFIKASWEIGMNALQVKLKKIDPRHILPHEKHTMRGAGIGFRNKKYITHTTLHHSKSAIRTFVTKQILFLTSIATLIIVGLFMYPIMVLQILVGILSFIYFVDVVFNLFLILKSLHVPQEITFTPEELEKLSNRSLPVYSILCPLYKEAHIVPQFLDAISKLDYPKEKLDVLLLLEEDDKATIETIRQMPLPSFVRTVVVPHSMPKTKPKACNYGLSQAKGEYLVIFDAEDIPDPLQLKKAYLGFQKAGKNVICLQAKLNYYNPNQNLLTRFFTAEYSLWFDVTLTGLQSINTSIPLGGTSNHFKVADLHKLEGWDPFNVTEDADLGIRLFKEGYQTAMIDSTTMEEANSKYGNWLRQRSRWIKGYMQTYLVHTREILPFFRKKKIHALVFHLVVGGKIAFILINPFLWILTFSYFALYSFVGPAIEALYPSIVFYMAVISLVFGNFLFMYYYMIGCAKKGQWELIKYVLCIPLYWLMISIAGAIAAYQLIFKPHYWEKTVHGLHLKQIIQPSVAAVPLPQKATLGFPFPFYTGKRFLQALSNKKTYVLGFSLVVASALASVINFFFSIYFANTLTLGNFGLVSFISALISITSIISGSLGITVNNKSGSLIGKYGEPEAYTFWKFIRKRSFIISIVITLLWVILTPALSSYFHNDSIYTLLFFSPVLLVTLLYSSDQGFLSSRLHFGYLAILSIFEPAIKFFIAFLLNSVGLTHWVYTAIPCSLLVSFLVGWVFVVKGMKKKQHMTEAKELRTFPRKFFIASLLSGFSIVMFLNMDIIFAKRYLNLEDMGLYSVIALTGKIIFFLGALVSPFIIPLVSRHEGANKDTRKILNYTLLGTLVLILPAFIALGIFGEFTVPLLFGKKALLTFPYLLPICFGMLCFTLSRVYTDYYLAKKYYSFTVLAFVLGVAQLVLISIFHTNVSSFVYIVSGTWILYFVATFVLHVFAAKVKTVEINIADFFSLFNPLQTPVIEDKTKLRILIFNWRDTRHVWAGGAEVYIHELSKRWVQDGNSVTIFCGNSQQSPRNEIKDGIQIYRRGGFYMVYVWAVLYYIFKFRGKYDVIIDSENGVPFFTPLYAKEKVFLLIHHVHQEVFRKSLTPPFSWLASFLELKVMPFVYRNTQVLTVSPSSKKEILAHKLTKIDPVIIYNGVDLTKFTPSQKSEKPLVLYVGRLQYYKSLHVFIKAARELSKKIPDAQFIIAGEGGEKKNLIKYAGKLGMLDKITFLGRVSEEEKIALFQKAWVFVNPSFMEGWGITTIEANACGTPAVASDVQGLQDSIQHNETGFLVEYGNVEAFAQKIEMLITDTKLRKHMSQESVAWANNFSWDTSAKQAFTMLLPQTQIGNVAVVENIAYEE